MRALVTGATGFVGSHLAERLVAEGAEVVCTVRPTSRLRWLEGLDVETRLAPLADRKALAAAAADADVVFHAAGLTRARTEATYLEANADATRRLLEATAEAGRGARFVYVSSLSAVGPNPSPEPMDETTEPHPLPGYGASKRAAERIVAGQDALPWTLVRPPSVYGPRDPNFVTLFRTAQRWGLCPILGSAEKALSIVHAADLADGLWRAGTADAAAGQTYFLGSGTHTWGEFADALGAALGRRVRKLTVPGLVARLIGELGELKWTLTGRPQIVCRRKVRDALQDRWTCSWAKAERDLGYRPRVSLEEGLRETARWYADQGWIRPLRA
ncbi:MAG: NAD-dependent epimerase/dehydratase family protein [bacterium]